MAERGATPAVLTELAKTQNQPCHLVQIVFDDVTSYLTDAYKIIPYDGNDYLAAGSFLSFSDIEETTDLTVTSLSLTISGVDQSFMAAILSKDFIDRQVLIYKAFLDVSDDSLIADPLLIFDGRMDAPFITEDPDAGTCEVVIKATNAWVDFQRRPGRRTSNAEQQLLFAGDLGMEFASEVTKEISWGRGGDPENNYIYRLR